VKLAFLQILDRLLRQAGGFIQVEGIGGSGRHVNFPVQQRAYFFPVDAQRKRSRPTSRRPSGSTEKLHSRIELLAAGIFRLTTIEKRK
jgi:hypothetical protein